MDDVIVGTLLLMGAASYVVLVVCGLCVVCSRRRGGESGGW